MNKKLTIWQFIIILTFCLIVSRLFYLQVIDGDKYKRLSEANRFKIIKILAPRGIIYDRNKVELVKNIPIQNLYIINNGQISDLQELSRITELKQEYLQWHLYKATKSSFIPIKLKQGLTFNEIAVIESAKSDIPGLFIETEISREYIFGQIGAHLLGYLGDPSLLQIKNNPDISSDILIGQSGIEVLFNKQLMGIPGEKIIEINALGRELRLVKEKPPISGENINLSIDIKVQRAAEKAFDEHEGALVAMNPNSGEILAMVSLPSFDPNIFLKNLSYKQWNKLVKNEKKPMLNRSVQSQYPPGSIFKIVISIAALEEGIINTETTVNCSGGITYGKWKFGCWNKKGHGTVNLHQAIVSSCDVYFYEIGKRLGIEKIYKYATMLGLGKKTDLNLVEELNGLIPNIKWKQEKKKRGWYLGDTFISSIGQGFVSVTPIQMAQMMSILGNGGFKYRPTLIKGEYEPIETIKLKQKTIKIIKESLYGVVNEPTGTGRFAQSGITTIGGKTGTSQVVGKKVISTHLKKFKDHSWFIAIAPINKPEIAVAVIVEHGGHGGAVAAPIAKSTIEAYFKSKRNAQKNIIVSNSQ